MTETLVLQSKATFNTGNYCCVPIVRDMFDSYLCCNYLFFLVKWGCLEEMWVYECSVKASAAVVLGFFALMDAMYLAGILTTFSMWILRHPWLTNRHKMLWDTFRYNNSLHRNFSTTCKVCFCMKLLILCKWISLWRFGFSVKVFQLVLQLLGPVMIVSKVVAFH